MDSGITIYALYKTTVLQNKLTESLSLSIEIKRTTYYLLLPIPLNFAPLVNGNVAIEAYLTLLQIFGMNMTLRNRLRSITRFSVFCCLFFF